MNIVVDVGNTFTKVGIFENDTLQGKEVFDAVGELQKFLFRTPAENLLISSVTIGVNEMTSWSIATGLKIILHPELPLPIQNRYTTPTTLGVDRLAAACGAKLTFPDQDCLVVDIGTCINYEFINKTGEYLGGAISPGVRMRFEAMHRYTAKLPLAPATEAPLLIGDATISCLQSGVMNGMCEEINGIIQRYDIQYPGIRVILSGGDAPFFENHLNPTIFVAPDLVLIGLNSILLHNVAL